MLLLRADNAEKGDRLIGRDRPDHGGDCGRNCVDLLPIGRLQRQASFDAVDAVHNRLPRDLQRVERQGQNREGTQGGRGC